MHVYIAASNEHVFGGMCITLWLVHLIQTLSIFLKKAHIYLLFIFLFIFYQNELHLTF